MKSIYSGNTKVRGKCCGASFTRDGESGTGVLELYFTPLQVGDKVAGDEMPGFTKAFDLKEQKQEIRTIAEVIGWNQKLGDEFQATNEVAMRLGFRPKKGTYPATNTLLSIDPWVVPKDIAEDLAAIFSESGKQTGKSSAADDLKSALEKPDNKKKGKAD